MVRIECTVSSSRSKLALGSVEFFEHSFLMAHHPMVSLSLIYHFSCGNLFALWALDGLLLELFLVLRRVVRPHSEMVINTRVAVEVATLK